MDDRGNLAQIPAKARTFSFLKSVQTGGSSAHRTSYARGAVDFRAGIKWPE